MRTRDTLHVWMALLAAAADASAILGGFFLALWLRFHSGWFDVPLGVPPMGMYVYGAGVTALLFLLLFRGMGLYERPQQGSFTDQIPRLVRAVALGMLLSSALAFAVRTDPPFSRLLFLLAVLLITLGLLLERSLLFALEWRLTRRVRDAGEVYRTLVVGAGPAAADLREALERDPRQLCSVSGFLRSGDEDPDPRIPGDLLLGGVDNFEHLAAEQPFDRLIVSDGSLAREQLLELASACERRLVEFAFVPDLFGLLVSGLALRHVGSIPLIGFGKWPLDAFGNRTLKRIEDILGALAGLALSAPVIAVAAWLIRRESPGPVFYRQERCGVKGRPFILYKLRTMQADAEEHCGPVWTAPDDPRRTRVGAFLRRNNLDELPQFWNVLKGDMSLVGPRPERPHFVEQFRTDFQRYMWRHVSRPGLTGWAQVNGLRGRTSLTERLRHDLYYLEHWSLAFDFKILLRTLISRSNAY